jgi:hypothetical protein
MKSLMNDTQLDTGTQGQPHGLTISHSPSFNSLPSSSSRAQYCFAIDVNSDYFELIAGDGVDLG